MQQTPHSILKEYFGYDSFREGQETLIRQILSGGDVLGIMPTGAGKSICYQVPAMLMPGLTIALALRRLERVAERQGGIDVTGI